MRIEYAAGFFDGEGCIHKCKIRAKAPKQLLRLSVGQLDVRPLELLQELFGGQISSRIQANGKTLYLWQLNKQPLILRALQQLSPFLIVKAEQAETAMKLLERFACIQTLETEISSGPIVQNVGADLN